MGVYHMISNTWKFEPFVDEDGTIQLHLGLWGDSGDYAEVTISAADVDRANRYFGDLASRLDETARVADQLVADGTWDLARRDAVLRQRCRQLISRLDVAIADDVRTRRADPA